MNKKLKIRDLTLRDGQQSLFATRMTGEQINQVIDIYKEAGFYAMEVWGGAVKYERPSITLLIELSLTQGLSSR